MSVPDPLSPRILSIRGLSVILDADLARLYGVTTSRLNEQVRRNPARFPPAFAFRLENQEFVRLMSQNAISKKGRGGARKPPLVFTEHGAVMAASVLNSPQAVEVSIHIVRAFVRLREAWHASAAIRHELDALDRRLGGHDLAIQEILETLRRLTEAPPQPRRRIGFL